mmetsp:Transcript_1038/g.1242  ORF Transcript_1038/g.1242 Transcript_1038/m.1242 type:complete len:134 (+) Transcript_1038:444-845(+)
MQGSVKLKFDITEGMATEQKYQIPFNMYVRGTYFGDVEILSRELDTVGRDGTAEVLNESYFLYIDKLNLSRVLKSFPNIKREMRYVASERKARHEENIDIIRKKFAEMKREIIRDRMEESSRSKGGYESRPLS